MNIWEILGIAYTTDVTEIKRAYAKRAKECHPEEHPDEFQRLQNAYKIALKVAKAGRKGQKAQEVDLGVLSVTEKMFRPDGQEIPKESRELPPEDSRDYDFSEVADEERRKAQQIKEKVWKEITYIIYNPFARNCQAMWRFFLHREDVWRFFRQQDNQEAFVRLICRERFAGWHRDQIEFFHCYLETLQSAEAPNRELLSKEWNWLRRSAGTERELITSPCLTPEEKQNYYFIDVYSNRDLRNVIGIVVPQRKSRDEQYLLWYLDYAAKNEDKLSKYYQNWVNFRQQSFEEICMSDYEKQYRCMLMNPYVRNNVRLWQYYLNRKEIRDMLQDSDTCARFIRWLIANRYLKWNLDILLYFQEYLTELQPDGKAPLLLYTEDWIWLLKHAVKGKRQDKAPVLTRQEKKVWEGLQEWDGSQDDGSEQMPEEQYLSLYWKYILLNEKSISDLHNKARNAGRFRNHLKYYLLFIAIAAVVYFRLFCFHEWEGQLKRYESIYEQQAQSTEEEDGKEFEKLMEDYENLPK